jgi:hypothetical protein
MDGDSRPLQNLERVLLNGNVNLNVAGANAMPTSISDHIRAVPIAILADINIPFGASGTARTVGQLLSGGR